MSTSALMGRRPIAISRCCSHFGDGPFFTPRTSRSAKPGQSSGASIVTFTGHSPLPATGSTAPSFSLPRPDAARSRAMPWTLVASGRFGVRLISITGSSSLA